MIGESGVYQITLSVTAEAPVVPSADQPYLDAILTVNGAPMFGNTSTSLRIANRSSSTFVVQAPLTTGDEVGASISTIYPTLGYMNRSLSIIELSVS